MIRYAKALGISESAQVFIQETDRGPGARKTIAIYANENHVPCIVIELSQKGYTAEAEFLAFQAISRMLALRERMATSAEPETVLVKLADGTPEMSIVKLAHRISFDDDRTRLVPGLKSMQHVSKDAVIGYRGDGSEILMPCDGYVTFPKYPERDAQGRAIGPKDISIVSILTKMEDGEA